MKSGRTGVDAHSLLRGLQESVPACTVEHCSGGCWDRWSAMDAGGSRGHSLAGGVALHPSVWVSRETRASN